MNDLPYAQDLLMKAWKEKTDQYNCLNAYLENLENQDELLERIEQIYDNLDERDDTIFLSVLKNQYQRNPTINENIQDLAYRLLSDLLDQNKVSSRELLTFNKLDNRLSADTMWYELQKNKRFRR